MGVIITRVGKAVEEGEAAKSKGHGHQAYMPRCQDSTSPALSLFPVTRRKTLETQGTSFPRLRAAGQGRLMGVWGHLLVTRVSIQ